MNMRSVFGSKPLQIFALICFISVINGYPSSIDEKKDCSNYCFNGGICVLIGNSRQCYCLPEWEGELCENQREYQLIDIDSVDRSQMSSSRVDPCSLVPPTLCNGGLCQFKNNKYSCACPSHLVGARCELPSPCNDFCYNEGLCSLDDDDVPSCNCTEKFEGLRCHSPVTISPRDTTTTTTTLATTNALCVSYQEFCGVGKCYNLDNGNPRCRCPSTHTGDFCEKELAAPPGPTTVIPVNPGTVNPGTVNPGTVTAVVTYPPSGNSNACASNPCLNSRPCYNTGNDFFCYCGTGLTGKRCESTIG